MNRIIVIGILLLLVGVNVSGDIDTKESSTVFDGNILYVGGSGPNNYSKIRDAIYDAIDGDTVFVYSGIYYEYGIYINHRISLIGEDKNNTIIHKIRGGLLDCIKIISGGVKIQGFTIENSTYNTFFDFGFGIFIHCDPQFVENISDVTITGNIIQKNPGGILIYEDNHDTVRVSNINISNNIIRKPDHMKGDAIRIYSEAWNLCDGPSNISILNNKIKGYGEGIYLDGCNNIKVANNHLNLNVEGIYVMEVENLNISRNLIKFNLKGIYLGANYYNDDSVPNISICENNFILNFRSGLFFFPRVFTLENIKSSIVWNNNFWNRHRFYPKMIPGKYGGSDGEYSRGMFVDYNPASEPYDIEV